MFEVLRGLRTPLDDVSQWVCSCIFRTGTRPLRGPTPRRCCAVGLRCQKNKTLVFVEIVWVRLCNLACARCLPKMTTAPLGRRIDNVACCRPLVTGCRLSAVPLLRFVIPSGGCRSRGTCAKRFSGSEMRGAPPPAREVARRLSPVRHGSCSAAIA